jgi:hypothetical protein
MTTRSAWPPRSPTSRRPCSKLVLGSQPLAAREHEKRVEHGAMPAARRAGGGGGDPRCVYIRCGVNDDSGPESSFTVAYCQYCVIRTTSSQCCGAKTPSRDTTRQHELHTATALAPKGKQTSSATAELARPTTPTPTTIRYKRTATATIQEEQPNKPGKCPTRTPLRGAPEWRGGGAGAVQTRKKKRTRDNAAGSAKKSKDDAQKMKKGQKRKRAINQHSIIYDTTQQPPMDI